ncbi:hypothetical protein [Microbaculum marinum]|uniref:Uncharacterized protein n=1 Tax=Microbaculum marinum TaxID=1764581 RepID=A0AAW9RQ60_9HYPH
MRTLRAVVLSACLAAGASAVAAGVSAAELVKTQPPCPGVCVSMGAGDTTVVARKISFDAPRKGTAVVTFHGTLYCLSNRALQTNFIIYSQIVIKGAPDPEGPSGLSFIESVEPYDGNSRTVSFNLASTRVYNVGKPGKRTYQFKLAPFGMPADAGCSVYSGAFTVQFSS